MTLPMTLLPRGLVALLLVSPLVGCGGSQKGAKTANDEAGAAPAQADRSRCDAKDKKVVEHDVNKDGKADVWKFYAGTVEQGAKVDVLTCVERDLNFDRHKDVWVYYDDHGNVSLEEFDFDFDGKVDLSTYRQQGKIVRQELDTNFDGKPDVWKYYENDKLARLERSSSRNGKVDVWEYYEGGRLDRIGYDTTGAGRADKFDRAPEEPEQAAAANAPPPQATPAANKAPAAAPKAPTASGKKK